MKIAKILTGSPDNQKGFFNNVMERTKQLMLVEPNVDCYMIRLEYGFILRVLKRQFKKPLREDYCTVNGIKFRNLWITMGLLDYLLTHRLHRRVIIGEKQLSKYIEVFKDYRLISSHGIDANYFAIQIKKSYDTPLVTTWHGSDINIAPFYNNKIKKEIKSILDKADHNFFVSQRLLDTSLKVSNKDNKSVLYTGPADIFCLYEQERKNSLREKYHINTKYVIGFVGNLIEIKNVLVLPEIFKKIQLIIPDISFVIVGDGSLSSKLLEEFEHLGILHLYYFGRKNPDKMPDIMNILDVLVLPSFNEGLPRVTLEAQACGVHVVGSNRGGIPEAIGIENCFELDANFIENIVFRIAQLLSDKNTQSVLLDKFSWKAAILKEQKVHSHVLAKL